MPYGYPKYRNLTSRTPPQAASAIVEKPEWDPDHVYAYRPANNYRGSRIIDRGDAEEESGKVIQAAIDYVAGKGGGVVWIIEGEYDLNSSIIALSDKAYVNIVGNNAVIKNGEISISGTHHNNNKRNRIVGLRFDNASIVISNGFGNVIEYCVFENAEYGIKLHNTATWTEFTHIRRCDFIKCTIGILFETPDGGAGQSYANTSIDSCSFSLSVSNSYGIKTNSQTQLSDSKITGCRFWHNVDNTIGIYIYGHAGGCLIQSKFESFVGTPTNVVGIDIAGASWATLPVIVGGGFSASGFTAKINNLTTARSRGLKVVGVQNLNVDNLGTATIMSGATSVTVDHGLDAKPRIVIPIPRSNIGSIWVSNVTDTQFTINCSSAPTEDVQVDWYAEV